MADRVASDHPTVETVDATLETWGPTDRPRLALPSDADIGVEDGTVIPIEVDNRERHARVTETADGSRVIPGIYDTPALAREPGDGENRLAGWVADRDLDVGRTAHVDVIEPGYAYGLRAPGERVHYDAPDGPDDSLAAIAERTRDR